MAPSVAIDAVRSAAGLLGGQRTYLSHCTNHNLQKIKKEKNQLHASRVEFIHTLTYLKDENDSLQGFEDAKVTGGLLEQCSPDQSTDEHCCFIELFAAKQTDPVT